MGSPRHRVQGTAKEEPEKLIIEKTVQKTRNSNIELLRIIAMVMILGLHVNFLAIGGPSTQDITSSPFQSFIRLFAEYICIVGVNIFVLISGWFGINYKPKGIVQFLFQSMFFSLIIFISFAIAGDIKINRLNIMSSFLLYKNAYWFVWAYLVLYIMAPMLNAFIEKNDRQTLKKFLLLFFVIQTIASIFTSVGFYKAGYDPLSFIGLYLLARYFRLYKENTGKYIYLFIFTICVLLNTLVCLMPPFFGKSNGLMVSITWMYTNPLNIIGALTLLLFFTKLNFKSKAVNYVATSCFAVYLLHMHFCISDYYLNTAKELYERFSGITYFATIIVLFVAVFIASIILDRIRIVCFNYLWNKYEKIKH